MKSFVDYLYNQGKSPNTIKAYSNDVNAYLSFANSSTLIRDNILFYKKHLQRKNTNGKTINRILSALKQYNQYLIEKGVQENLVILSNDYISIQRSFTNPNEIAVKEINTFLSLVKKNEPYRNYAVIMVIANTGLRISEALSLRLDNIFLDNNEAVVIGKGNKQREFIIFPEAVKVIKEYCTEHRKLYKYANISPYLFVSNKAEKLHPATIQRIFNKYSNKITPHKLRHFFADNYYKKTKDIRVLQEQLGHSNLNTTMIYTYPSKDDRKGVLNLIKVGSC